MAANQLFLLLFVPSGVWVRRVVREHPLAKPIAVTGIEGLTLIAGAGRYTLAGVVSPTDAEGLARLDQFLHLATAQGIEIESDAALPHGQSVRCEPRVWHWCGNDPVAAHFEQFNLNELLIALGYARIAPEVQKLTTPAAVRLRAAERYANEAGQGSDSRTSVRHGIDISVIAGVHSAIRMYADEIAETDHAKQRH